jgi:hypothetical protein
MLIVIAVADVLRTRRLGLRFTPERWTMVFPLGCTRGELGARGRPPRRVADRAGHAWLAVAFTAWTAVAYGELRHLLCG